MKGEYDMSVDHLMDELQKFKLKHGNVPVTIMWGSSSYDECHWKGQVSFLFHEPDDEEYLEVLSSEPSYPRKQLLISIY